MIAVPTSVQGTEHLLSFTLLQIGIIIAAARLAGYIARQWGQPRAVGEIVAGLLLGPSLFGALAPESFRWVFRSVDATPLTIMSQIGLILLMFQVGLAFDFSQLRARQNRQAVLLITLASIALPFGLGFGFGELTAKTLAGGINPLAYALFLGIALTRSRIGVITIAAAAANDAIGWVLLALVSAVATQQLSWQVIAGTLGCLLAYLALSWLLVRPLLLRLLRRWHREDEALPQDLLAIVLIAIFGSALLTSQLGIFAIFGGFVAGMLLHDQTAFVEAWQRKMSALVNVFFLPIFFTYTGLRTDVGGLGSTTLWGWCGLLIVLAVLGKLVGCYLASRLAGLSRAEATNIALMMNTRALMELIVVNLGYDLGIIPREVFTMLVLMAVASTLLTAPGLRLGLPRMGHRIPSGADG
jgi:Kef-type K+ transport system membrane component KefB